MPSTRSGGASRNVRHGNTMNRSGTTVAQFEKKAVVKAQRPMKVKKTTPIPSEPTQTITDHTVIVAQANKLPKSIK